MGRRAKGPRKATAPEPAPQGQADAGAANPLHTPWEGDLKNLGPERRAAHVEGAPATTATQSDRPEEAANASRQPDLPSSESDKKTVKDSSSDNGSKSDRGSSDNGSKSDRGSKSRDERSGGSSDDTSEKDTNDSSPDSADDDFLGARNGVREARGDVTSREAAASMPRGAVSHGPASTTTAVQSSSNNGSTNNGSSSNNGSAGDQSGPSQTGTQSGSSDTNGRRANGGGISDGGVSAASAPGGGGSSSGGPVLIECSGTDTSIWDRSDDDMRRLNRALLIKNINHRTTVPQFCDILAEQGFTLSPTGVTCVHVPVNRKKHKARGFAVVHCASRELARQVYTHFDGLKLERHRKFRALPADRLESAGILENIAVHAVPEGYEPAFAPGFTTGARTPQEPHHPGH